MRGAAALAGIAVVFGGPSPEHDVSILTGLQAVRALVTRPSREEVTALYWSKTGELWRCPVDAEAKDFADGVPRSSGSCWLQFGRDAGLWTGAGRLGRDRRMDVDVVVNCCHGGPGEDGTLSGLLALAGLHHAGPSVAGAVVAMDKLVFARLAEGSGLPCLPRVPIEADRLPDLDGPLIVKPRRGGSSIGVEVVADAATAVARAKVSPHLRGGAVAEPYRPELFDLNVAVRTWPELALSAIERPIRSTEQTILGYADKYVPGEGMAAAARELPAKIGDQLADQLRELARVTARLADVRAVARIDFLSDGEQLFVNEVNAPPGSLARYLWVDPPLDFGVLLGDLVQEARATPPVVTSVAGADGSLLRQAASIASKLA